MYLIFLAIGCYIFFKYYDDVKLHIRSIKLDRLNKKYDINLNVGTTKYALIVSYTAYRHSWTIESIKNNGQEVIWGSLSESERIMINLEINNYFNVLLDKHNVRPLADSSNSFTID